MTKILIVDDSAFLRRILKGYLAKKRPEGSLTDGCILLEAESKEQALRLYKEERPEVILLDIVMNRGDRDGIEFLMEMMKENNPPKVIMMSAIGQDRVMAECRNLGALEYIIKPFDEQQVIATVDSVLANESPPSFVSDVSC